MIACLFVCLLPGCAGNEMKTDSFSLSHPSPSREHRVPSFCIQPGDNFDVIFPYHSELNENAVVRPDGKISLQLIDEVTAAGLTPPELEQRIREKYSRYLKNPDVSLILRSFGGQRVYVGGQVYSPGVINLKGPTSAVQAIVEAGGFRTDANRSDVIIVSRGKDNSPVVREVNLKQALTGKPDREAMGLKPYDVVYVPQSSVVKASEWIHHLYNFIPPNIWFGFSYELHRDSYAY